MKAPLKISSYVDEVEKDFETPAAYSYQPISNGHQRLVVGVPDGDAEVLLALLQEIQGPFYILYVLHTPRGEAAPGRYQSPSLSAEEIGSFITRFKSYLAADARFDLWVHSPTSKATVVWDRHNQIFAYGPLRNYEDALKGKGFSEQLLPSIEAHIHHYRSEFDAQAKDLLQSFPWSHSPLKPEDEQ